MTCIIGIVTKDGVYMGADSGAFNSDDLSCNLREDPKIFKKGNMIIGFCSSFRMGQILRYSLKIPKQPSKMDDFHFMTTTFIEAIKLCFMDNDYSDFKEDDCNFMIGYKGKLYVILPDFQVALPKEGYSSIGGGDALALGAIFALKGEPPEKIMEVALNAAEAHSMVVRKPFIYVSLPNKKIIKNKREKKK